MAQVVGALGLLLSIVGFAVTLWQIKGVRSSADAQREAIDALRFRLSQFDVVSECAKADTALGELRKWTYDEDSTAFLAALDRLAVAFVSIMEGSLVLSEGIVTRLRVAQEEIDKLASGLSRQPLKATSHQKLLATFRRYHGIVVKVRAEAQEEART